MRPYQSMIPPEKQSLQRSEQPSPLNQKDFHNSPILIERLVQHTIDRPQAIAFRFPTEKRAAFQTFSWRASLDEISRLAHYLRQAGVAEKDRLAIMTSSPREQIFIFLAAAMIGAIPTIVSYPSPKQTYERFTHVVIPMLRASRAAWLVAGSKETTALNWILEKGLNIATLCFPTTDLCMSFFDETKIFQQDDICFLQYSSGTTGLRKGIAITHRMLAGFAEAYGKVIGLTVSDRMVSWVPLYHDMGLIGSFLLPLYFGVESIHISPFEWLSQPSLLFQLVSRFKGTLVYLPNFAYSLSARRITDAELETIDISCLRAIFNGSEPVLDSVHSRFLQRFFRAGVSATMLQVIYGMAEAVLAVTQTIPGQNVSTDVIERDSFTKLHVAKRCDGSSSPTLTFVSCGKPVPGCSVRISGTSEERIIGEIEIKCPWLFDGYLSEGEVPRDKPDPNLWFSTGDLGYLADGELYVTGRKKDLIIHRGLNVYPTDIEEIVQQNVPGIRPGRVVAFGISEADEGTEAIVLMLELDGKERDTISTQSKIRRVVQEHLDITVGDIQLCDPDTLIKSTSGKLSRSENRLLYKRLRSSAVQCSDAAARDVKSIGVASLLCDIWRAVLKTEDIRAESLVFEEFATSSLEIMTVISEVRRIFGIDLEPPLLLGAGSVQEQSRLIGQALCAQIDSNNLITLNHGEKSKRPFFLAYGADGHAYNYLRLVRSMDRSRPVKALVSPSHNSARPFRITSELIQDYGRAILEDTPDGPYVLGGWSYGGLLAFRLARHLIEAGKKVAAIVMFDVSPITHYAPRILRKQLPKLESLLLDGHILPPRVSSRLRRVAEQCCRYSPTDRLIAGVRNDTSRNEVLKLARFVLRGHISQLEREFADKDSSELLEELAKQIEEIDGNRFGQMFIPGQSGARLHRSALVFKNNLLDGLSFTSGWVFPGTIYNICQMGHSAVRRWQQFSLQAIVHEYPIRPLAGKDAHSSMMDEPNLKLFVGALSHYLNSLDAFV